MKADDVEIRRATTADLDLVVDVYCKSFIPMVLGYHPNADPSIFDRERLTAMWAGLIANEPVFLIWLKTTGTPVAVLGMKFTSRPQTIELAKLFVVPEAQSTGVARIASDFAIDFALLEGFEEIELWTWEISRQSRRFYEKVGFSLTDDRGTSGYSGIAADADVTVRYVKKLT